MHGIVPCRCCFNLLGIVSMATSLGSAGSKIEVIIVLKEADNDDYGI